MCLRVYQHANKYVRDALYRFIRYKSRVARGANKQKWHQVSSLPDSRSLLFAYNIDNQEREREKERAVTGESNTARRTRHAHGIRLIDCIFTDWPLYFTTVMMYWWNKFSYVITSWYAQLLRAGNTGQGVLNKSV